MKKFLAPLSILYSQITNIRNTFYDSGVFVSVPSDVTVVSIGNLTMGGTGKTPLICEFLKWALAQNLKPAMISKGYMGTYKEISRVKPDSDAGVYGDEPTMVARRFPQIPVYVGKDRSVVLKHLLKVEDVNIVFADDAFQHRRLSRHIDIVVLDCTESISNYDVIPLGRGREKAANIRRADFIILNKVNLASPEHKQKILEFIAKNNGDKNIPIIESEYHTGDFISLDGKIREKPARYEKVILVSGIGRPLGFERLIGRNFNILKHFAFRDHHEYTQAELKKIVSAAQELKADKIIVTEKDAVKLFKFLDIMKNTWVAELTPKLSIRARSLYEQILAKIN